MAHKEARKSIKRDKRSHRDSLAWHAEEAAGNTRELYNIIKKLSARYKLTLSQSKTRKENIDISRGTAKEISGAFQ